jgi:hypothetical protein
MELDKNIAGRLFPMIKSWPTKAAALVTPNKEEKKQGGRS